MARALVLGANSRARNIPVERNWEMRREKVGFMEGILPGEITNGRSIDLYSTLGNSNCWWRDLGRDLWSVLYSIMAEKKAGDELD